VFESRLLREWTSNRNIEIETGSPYHPQSNGIVERVIRSLKTFMSMYPKFPGGYKAGLEDAVNHYNRSYHSTIGCSPHFALNGEVSLFPADVELKIADQVVVMENRFSQEAELKNARRKRTTLIKYIISALVNTKWDNKSWYGGVFHRTTRNIMGHMSSHKLITLMEFQRGFTMKMRTGDPMLQRFAMLLFSIPGGMDKKKKGSG
jgi:hypothetical protein